MSRSKLPALAELRKQLRSQPAPANRSARAGSASTVQPADPPSDASLFHAAVNDVHAMPATDRAELHQDPPPPIPRRKDSTKPEEVLRKAHDTWVPTHWMTDTVTNGTTASTPEEQLLARVLHGVVPIISDKVFIEAPKPHPVPIQHYRDEQAALEESIYSPTPLELVLEGGDELYYLKVGIPRTTLRDLRRGRWVVQAQLDLHGSNRDEARDLLAAAFADWRKRDIRCVRIIHGKGLGSPGKEPILKKLVAGWLVNYDDVLGYCQARVHDGGAGALLVLMRASKR